MEDQWYKNKWRAKRKTNTWVNQNKWLCRTIVVSWAFEIYRRKIQHNNKRQEKYELY